MREPTGMEERHDAEAGLTALDESEARYRTVMETASDAIITIDETGQMLFVNPAVEKIFGYTPDELHGAELTMLMPEYLRHVHRAGLARYVETGHRHIDWQGVELPGLHKSGREITLEVSFGDFRRGGRHFFTGIARDISERKAAAKRIAAQHSVTRILAEATTLGEATPAILESMCVGLGWEMAALWAYDGEDNALRCVETWHAPSAGVSEFESDSMERSFEPGIGLPGRVLRSGEPAWIDDVAVDGNFLRAPLAVRDGLHGAFAFPIRLGSEVFGVIECFAREVRRPDAALLETIASIGSQIGQYIERRRAQDERAKLQSAIIAMQEAQLEELSTPLIPLTNDIVVMPLIGTLDSVRAQRMLNTLLDGIQAQGAKVAIIDITGVSVVDTHVANVIVQASQSARLLGTQVVLTGIRSGVARSLVGLGVELDSILTRKSLQSGIAYALRHLSGHDHWN